MNFLNHLVVFLVCLLSIHHLTEAALTQRVCATWNLQGSSASTEAKWTTNVRQLVVPPDAADVVALQEAGTVPASAKLQPSLGNRLIDPHDLKETVYEYEWNIGTTSRKDIRWIYYTQNDKNANRVNVALVSKERAPKVIVLRPPGKADSARPILGIQFGEDNYFTIHATANGGTDAAPIVNVVANYFASTQQYKHQFLIMGDFNRSPADLQSALKRQYPDLEKYLGYANPPGPTHRNGNTLDYGVFGQINYDLPKHLNVQAGPTKLQGQLVSDHYPVLIKLK